MSDKKYVMWFNKPNLKNPVKMYVSDILKQGTAILSSTNLDEAYEFESWQQAKDAIKKFEYPYLYGYNIEVLANGKLTPITEQDKKAVKPAKQKQQPQQQTSDPAPRKSGAVAQIIELYKSGKTKAEIIQAGFNKNTVNRQVGEYIKSQQTKK